MKTTVTAYSSAARTASPTDASVDVPAWARTAQVYIDATAIVTTPSVVFNVRGLNPGSGTSFLLLASAAVTAVSTAQLTIGPGIAAVANLAAQKLLPQTLVIDPVHADADSITYSVMIQFES